MKIFFLAVLAIAALSVTDAIIWPVYVGTTTSAVTLSTSAVSLGLLGGLAILKGLVLGMASLTRARKMKTKSKGKRSAEVDGQDAAFAVLANAEPDQCYKRLICDLAAGAIPDKDNIVSLFNADVSPVSPKFEYATAAKVGKLVKNAGLCELRYSCPLSTDEISKVFN